MWPLVARAQQPQKVPRIAILDLARPISERGLRRGLRELGYIEGQHIVIEARYANGQQDRLPVLIAEVLGLRVDLIASSTTQAIQMIRRIDATIPIVMSATSDPVGSGLVASLSRPGGHTTGVTILSSDVAGKRLELLKEVVPRVRRVAVLAYRNHPPTAMLIKETTAAARTLNIEPQFLEVDPDGIESAFAAMVAAKAEVVVVQQAVALNPSMPRIVELAAAHRLPSIHENRVFALTGGLMSYGANFESLGFRAASYVDKILKGTHPGDLPVEQPTKFDLLINLKTASALGIEVPPSILVRADEVIE